MLDIHGVRCSKCEAVIYSRAHYDMHYCLCGDIYIDGGFEYMRVGWKDILPAQVKFSLDITKKELYEDWNQKTDVYGVMTKEQCEDKEITEVELEEQGR